MDETHQPLPEARQPLIQRTLAEWKTLAILGGPILIAQVAQMANGVIDTVMAGHASAEDLAAVGIGSSLWMPPLFLFFMGLLGALQPIISGYNGARTTHKIMPATWQGIYIAAAGTVVMALLLTNVHPPFWPCLNWTCTPPASPRVIWTRLPGGVFPRYC